MDILIESTIAFEHDLGELTSEVTAAVMESINNCVRFPPSQNPSQNHLASDRLQRLPLRSELNGYESSLYVLKVLEKLSVILTIDEDPIFDQFIVTLFRAVKQDKLNRAYQSVAESLYQELTHTDREIVQAA